MLKCERRNRPENAAVNLSINRCNGEKTIESRRFGNESESKVSAALAPVHDDHKLKRNILNNHRI